ncbi:esterase [Bacillus sp. M6-12]|uniref:prolyl oligopeptidase family serine peptidase n=1 Tax=Bacillus sp. M6-12 TaxID=2054166 RepID=UPI000C792D40|nr:prolyl oligopeptidase family serine peptidase [Bacillus sp. M6-12]PLS15493.1 esterase [Bacillus sp. M6-12]
MICVNKEFIDTIPALHIAKQDIWNEQLPLIIFFHGFTSAKEHNLHYAYLLAEKGFRVILPDAYLHGERDQGINESKLAMSFWEVVIRTIQELGWIKQVFEDRGMIEKGKIGVAGTSMGGIVTLGALAVYDWVTAAVSLMGNPAYVKLAKLQIEEFAKMRYGFTLTEEEIQRQLSQLGEYDLSLQPEKIAGRPIMFWHGENDNVVPIQHAFELYESLLPVYEQSKDKLSFISDKRAGHKVSREGVLQTAEWFGKHMSPNVQNT